MLSKVVSLKSILAYQGLSSGYSFRGKINHIPKGGLRVIQLKDFENNYSSIGENCFLVGGENIKSKYFLEDGDILFTAKGSNNYALVYGVIDDIPTIASSAMFVLRINRSLADPYYVAWYINQSKSQNYLKTNESGTYVTSISKTTIEGIPITLPTLEVQTKVASVARLHNKKLFLENKITELKNILITNQLLNAL